MTLTIHPIPAFRDNYIWAFGSDQNKVYVVDPGDADPVFNYLATNNLSLAGILVTHHHPDHTGGIKALVKVSNVPVYGPSGGHIEGITHTLNDGDTIEVAGLHFQVMAVPGHTLDHIAFYCAEPSAGQNGIVFCGDTLFAAGCGRLFEGTPQMMYTSLRSLAALPANTAVYCTHEYTLNNLAFAVAAEPGNPDIAERRAQEIRKREADLPTLPTTISLELRTNPFLRCHSDKLRQTVSAQSGLALSDEIATFAALRRWKDCF
jgi:hydroxyacylglutathione hydrolase